MAIPALRRIIVAFWLLTIGSPVALSDNSARVETDSAIYIGVLVSYEEGNQTASYFGLPYAMPPLGQLRFAPPQPWRWREGDGGVDNETTSTQSPKPVLWANESQPACMQASGSSTSDAGEVSEDCLFLNVHSPTPQSPGARQPVLAWLHGGCLETGGVSGLEGPLGWDLVSRQRLLLVEVAYRLGLFGFLRLQDGSGNWGLLDQQLALTWIRDSISAFGGDPGAVTLGGVGAGAASAGLHLLSNGSQHLFHRVVMLGGGPLAPWLFASDADALDAVLADLLRRADCDRPANADALRCLRAADARVLAALQPPASRALDIAAFPVVADGRFISGSPAQLLAAAVHSKPALLGVTSQEGERLADRAIGHRNVSLLVGDDYQAVLEAAFPFFPAFPQRLSPTGLRLLSGRFTAFPGADAALGNRRLLASGLGLWHTACASNRLLDRLCAASANAFAYQMVEPDPGRDGATHGQDAAYFLGRPVRDTRYSPHQRDLSSFMMSALATFAATGDLSRLGWTAATADGLEFFRFAAVAQGQSGSGLRTGGFDRQDCLFWDRQLPWVNEVVTSNGTIDESEFWSRCNRAVNTVSIVAIAIGGGVCLLVLTLTIAVSTSRRRPARRRSASRRAGVDALELQTPPATDSASAAPAAAVAGGRGRNGKVTRPGKRPRHK